jgi:drug/metabolite transporter (DMT)-like permease
LFQVNTYIYILSDPVLKIIFLKNKETLNNSTSQQPNKKNRLERFDKACKYTQAKIAGTVVCLAGAVAMSFLQSPSSSSPSSSLAAAAAASAGGAGDDYYDWILGCCCLVAGVTVFALVTVLQAATLATLPAPLTMCCVTSATGAALTALLRLVLEGKFLDMGSPNIDATLVAWIVVLGGGVVGASTAFQAWCLGRKGPLFVSVFGPVQTVCTAILSAALLRQVLSLGRYYYCCCHVNDPSTFLSNIGTCNLLTL